jgi:RNA polymerase sigma-70 factor (ECF subfamily)
MSDAGRANWTRETASDWELVLATRRGDPDAFRVLCERYRSSLLAFFAARTGIGDTAEDLTQDVLVKVWRACQRNLPLVAFDRYLFRAAENRWKDYARSLQRPTAARNGEEDDVVDPSPGPDRLLLLRYEAGRIRRAVRDLPPELREVVVQNRLGGRKLREIAAESAIPLGTVKWRLSEAVRRLRQQLQDEVS